MPSSDAPKQPQQVCLVPTTPPLVHNSASSLAHNDTSGQQQQLQHKAGTPSLQATAVLSELDVVGDGDARGMHKNMIKDRSVPPPRGAAAPLASASDPYFQQHQEQEQLSSSLLSVGDDGNLQALFSEFCSEGGGTGSVDDTALFLGGLASPSCGSHSVGSSASRGSTFGTLHAEKQHANADHPLHGMADSMVLREMELLEVEWENAQRNKPPSAFAPFALDASAPAQVSPLVGCSPLFFDREGSFGGEGLSPAPPMDVDWTEADHPAGEGHAAVEEAGNTPSGGDKPAKGRRRAPATDHDGDDGSDHGHDDGHDSDAEMAAVSGSRSRHRRAAATAAAAAVRAVAGHLGSPSPTPSASSRGGSPVAKRSTRRGAGKGSGRNAKRTQAQAHAADDDMSSGRKDPSHNAKMAKLNRERKKAYVSGLEDRVAQLEDDAERAAQREVKLTSALAAARKEIAQLQQSLQRAPALAQVLRALGNVEGLSFASAAAADKAQHRDSAVVPIQLNLRLN